MASDITTTTAAGPEAAGAPQAADEARVPLWLALVNVVLLVVVLALTGVLVRTRMTVDEAAPRPALKQLEREARADETTQTLLRLGFEYEKAGMLDEALSTNRRVTELDPKNTAALYHIGSILIEMGRDDDAEDALRSALAIDPTHAMTAKALAELYRSREDYSLLLDVIEPAAAASPRLADLQALLGLAREKTGDMDGAARAYREAVRSDPSLADAREGLRRVTEGDR